MVDRAQFSPELLKHPEAKNAAALERIALAKKRVLSILDRETVAHHRTLEQKIAEQGPVTMRVDPHLVGLALKDMQNLRRVQKVDHEPSKTKSWYANVGTPGEVITKRLEVLGPLYASVAGGGFGNLTGDALEVIVFKCLQAVNAANPRYSYSGHFDLDQPKAQGRFRRTQPPKNLSGRETIKEADFLQFGHDAGPLCIECKNYREWFYPTDNQIKELIRKSYELGAIPVLIARRLHYTARTNLCEPAGIIAHESLFQYYPSDQAELANQVRHKRSLGFTDVLASEDPHDRTVKFFSELLPKIVGPMAATWNANKNDLYDYAMGKMNLSQLYNAIGSPAAGKWVDPAPP